MKSILILTITILSQGCATWEKDTLSYMGGGFMASAIVGATQAPKDDDKMMHALLWGGLTAATIGAVRLYTRNQNEEIRERDLKIKELNLRLSTQVEHDTEAIESSYGAKEMPEDIQKLIQPGLWKVFNINRWKKQTRGKYIHEDKILEFKPPEIKLTK